MVYTKTQSCYWTSPTLMFENSECGNQLDKSMMPDEAERNAKVYQGNDLSSCHQFCHEDELCEFFGLNTDGQCSLYLRGACTYKELAG